jgi:two-component system, chemotaxis family, protein-glutamate methylesterase/glutaminase
LPAISNCSDPAANYSLPADFTIELNMNKTRVLIVDDSALIRNLMKEIINTSPDLEAIGTAPDPLVAREMIRSMNPDVITLDVEMPKMDGLDFLERLMRLRPMPVVMVSTLTERGAEVTMKALELGAVDFVAKPKIGISQGMSDCAEEIRDKIRAASRARLTRKAPTPVPLTHAPPNVAQLDASSVQHKSTRAILASGSTEKIVAIGASTGGTEAIREVLTRLPADFPAVVITQHMPPGFTKSFAARLDSLCKISVKEAQYGERILPGHAYVAPGGKHFSVRKSGANYMVEISDEEPVNRHKPSVEVLFRSVAKNVGANALGVMLTGMGKDGASAMTEMKSSGAHNVAQDEASCVVFGMPREAIAAGAVHEVLPVYQIAGHLIEQLTVAGHHVRV